MASIQVLLVILVFGSMSIFRLSSLKILVSPFSPFCISMIGIEEIKLAILRQAVKTSGLSASEVYPEQKKSVSAGSESRNPIALLLFGVAALAFPILYSRLKTSNMLIVWFPTILALSRVFPYSLIIELFQIPKHRTGQSSSQAIPSHTEPCHQSFRSP